MHPVTDSPSFPDQPAAPVSKVKVPDLVLLNGGPLVVTAGLGMLFQQATDAMLAFANMALWWDQSGRPEVVGEGSEELRRCLEIVADVANEHGVNAAAKALGNIPPDGQWWSFGPFDAEVVDQDEARIMGLDTVLATAAHHQAEAEEELAELQAEVLEVAAMAPGERVAAALGDLAQRLQGGLSPSAVRVSAA